MPGNACVLASLDGLCGDLAHAPGEPAQPRSEYQERALLRWPGSPRRRWRSRPPRACRTRMSGAPGVAVWPSTEPAAGAPKPSVSSALWGTRLASGGYALTEVVRVDLDQLGMAREALPGDCLPPGRPRPRRLMTGPGWCRPGGAGRRVRPGAGAPREADIGARARPVAGVALRGRGGWRSGVARVALRGREGGAPPPTLDRMTAGDSAKNRAGRPSLTGGAERCACALKLNLSFNLFAGVRDTRVLRTERH